MDKTQVFDSLIISGIFIVGLVFLGFVREGMIDQIFVGNNKLVFLFPVCMIMVSLIFRIEGMLSPQTKVTKLYKEEIKSKNKLDSDEIVKKYDSMEDMK